MPASRPRRLHSSPHCCRPGSRRAWGIVAEPNGAGAQEAEACRVLGIERYPANSREIYLTPDVAGKQPWRQEAGSGLHHSPHFARWQAKRPAEGCEKGGIAATLTGPLLKRPLNGATVARRQQFVAQVCFEPAQDAANACQAVAPPKRSGKSPDGGACRVNAGCWSEVGRYLGWRRGGRDVVELCRERSGSHGDPGGDLKRLGALGLN